MAKLIISAGDNQGKEFVLGDSQVIGRLGRNAIPIKEDTAASREHARVYRKAGEWMVVDLNSSNGTQVNGERVQKATLRQADRLLVGSTWFEFQLEEADMAAQAPAARRAPEESWGGGEPTVETRERKGEISEKALQYSEHAASGRGGRGKKAGATTLAWMRADLAQTSGLYRTLVIAGVVALALGLGYLAYLLTAV